MNSNESIVLVCLLVLCIIVGYILFFTTFSVYVKTPTLCIFVLGVTFFIFILTHYWQSDKDVNIFTLMTKYFFIYGYFLFIILGVFFVCFLLYKVIMGTIVFTLSRSIWFTLGIIILILALLKETFYTGTSTNEYSSMIKDIIFYIPCLITDAIDYFKEDYNNTPSTTFIVFIMILIFCAIFFILPMFDKSTGHLLISDPAHLNTTVLSLSINDILKLDPSQYTDLSNTDLSNTDLSNSHVSYNIDSSHNIHYPYDSNTKHFIEGFSFEPFSILENDTNYSRPKVYPSDISGSQTNNVMFDPTILYNNRVVQNVIKAGVNTYSGYEALRDTIFTKSSLYNYSGPYLANYSISFWIYINTFHINTFVKQTDIIFTFGSRPSLYYDSIQREIIVKMINNQKKEEILYRTKDLLYQRWNYVVMNMNDTVMDLFINNNLVGHYDSKNQNINPQMDIHDFLTVGSKNNNDFGLICNFKYDKPLNLGQIQTNYKKYNKKSPPI